MNLAEHQDGKRVAQGPQYLGGAFRQLDDPCVGKFLEFRIARNPAQPDISQVPATLIPNPDLSGIPVARERIFEFNSGANQTTNDPIYVSSSAPGALRLTTREERSRPTLAGSQRRHASVPERYGH